MLSKLQNVKQSLRDVTAAIGDKASTAVAEAKKKITEIQQLPSELPESWEERIDENGKPYFVDTETGEWYRVKSKQHQRINTNEKLSIITAESKKEFDDQKQQMDLPVDTDESDSDIHTSDDDENNDTKQSQTQSQPPIDINIHQNGHMKPTKKSNHNKRSSTSVSKGWQCEKCTLENVGHAMQCNACLAPRPDSLDDDEDEMAINGGLNEHNNANNNANNNNNDINDDINDEDEDDDDDDDDSDSSSDCNSGHGHVQTSTIDAINSAVDESLSAVDGIDVKALSKDQRSKLITFMDFVEAEPKPSLRYLKESNWDIQVAMDTYLRQHPDHPKSRGGSLQFDLQQIAELYTDPINFEADIELPNDIGGQGVGRRDSTELDEIVNNNDGVRDSDNGSDGDDDDDSNDNDNSDDDESQDEQISYNNNNNNNNGVRNEYPIANNNQNNNYNNDYQSYAGVDQYGHRRMDTDQQIQIAEKLSMAQSEYDQQLDKYRKEIEILKNELNESRNENENLKKENIEIEQEKERFSSQAREIQNDWDRMSGYMIQILSEVSFIEEQRKNGKDISTPTPKLHNIFQAIQNTITRNNLDQIEEHDEKLENGKVDIYQNVADLFTEDAPILNLKDNNNNIIKEKKRKLSFGAVNELFPAMDMDMNHINQQINNNNNNNNELMSQNNNNNNFLSVGTDDDSHAKRLSYGGVGLLFDAFDNGDQTNNIIKDKKDNENNIFNPNQNNDNPLNVQFTPTYQGIASLFDENNDVLGTKSANKHRNKPSFAGDIVELFRNPNNEYTQPDDMDIQNNNNQIEIEQEEEDSDSMDEQRVYTYSDNDDNSDGNDDNSDEDDDNDEEEYKSASDKDIEPEVKKDNTNDTGRQSTHQRFESYASNASDPTPMSRRGSTSKKRHSRDTSFAFKDLFRGEEDSDNSDRAPSVQSAPEEHDYYAITAYYGIEDDDAAGWDSRRSSMFGDYGRVHSRRQSKRVQSGMVEDNIKDRFKVDLTTKLTQHLSAEATEDIDNVADLFYDETKPNNRSSKYKNPNPTINEEPNDSYNDNITDNANVVADLFDETNVQKTPIEHRKRDTYTGVKQLFGNDNNDSDNDDEDNDIDDDEFVEMRDNNLKLNENNKQVPRPSTNVALGATFDSISKIKDRVPKKNKQETKENAMETVKEAEIPVNTESIVQPPQIVQAEISERQIEEMRSKIQTEENAKLQIIQQELEDKKLKLESEYNNKLELMKQQLQSEIEKQLTISVTESIKNKLTNENQNYQITIENELNNKFESELNNKLNEKLESELDNKLNNKISELQNTFNNQITELKNTLNQNEQKYKSEMKLMEKSKCDLIQRTAQEIDSLRQIIKNQFNQNQIIQNNNNGLLGGLLKWG